MFYTFFNLFFLVFVFPYNINMLVFKTCCLLNTSLRTLLFKLLSMLIALLVAVIDLNHLSLRVRQMTSR